MQLQEFINIYENVVPLDLCDELLSTYADSQEWVAASILNNQIDANARNCSRINISIIPKDAADKELREDVDKKLFGCVGNAIRRYSEDHPKCRIEKDSGYDLLRYETGQFYLQHTDSYKDLPRSVSCSLALNDDYDGGEFAFFDRDLKVKLPKGAAIMFPSNFMYPHEIMPVVSGTRYSIITWFI